MDLPLIDKAPFKSKMECANVLNINRSTVAAHLDTNKPYKNKWILSCQNLTEQELSKWVVPCKVWEIVTGKWLGDGCIIYDPIKALQVNAILEFTFSSKILYYVK